MLLRTLLSLDELEGLVHVFITLVVFDFGKGNTSLGKICFSST